jgi:hypothetical protein
MANPHASETNLPERCPDAAARSIHCETKSLFIGQDRGPGNRNPVGSLAGLALARNPLKSLLEISPEQASRLAHQFARMTAEGLQSFENFAISLEIPLISIKQLRCLIEMISQDISLVIVIPVSIEYGHSSLKLNLKIYIYKIMMLTVH